MRTLTALEALSYGMFGDTARFQDVLRGKGSLSSAHRALPEARLQLRDAIGNGVVKARGYRVNLNQPPITRELLESELFKKIKDLAVDFTGETIFLPPASPKNIPRWEHIIFDEKEIKNLWSKTKPIIDAWMENDFEVNPIQKRDARIADCKLATGCTVREAKGAYERIKPDKKLRRGQRLTGRSK